MSIIPNYVPSGFHLINAVIHVRHAQKAIEWYNRAFGAEEILRLTDSRPLIKCAQMKIVDTIFMIQEDPDVREEISPVEFLLYTPDAQAFMEQASRAGAEVLQKVKMDFKGDRVGQILDPFYHRWLIATHVEHLTVREIQKRFHEMYS